MSLVLNMVGGGSGGGGPSASDAILTVTVPTGSTVTMTKGGVTLTPTMWVRAADNTLDCALFVIQSSLFDSQNAWTVAASLSGDSASDTITIDSNEQYEMVLTYAYYLFRAGVGEVVPLSTSHENNATITIGTNAITVTYKASSGQQTSCHNTTAIDITDYSQLCIVGTITGRGTQTSYGGQAIVSTAAFTTSTAFNASTIKAKTEILTGATEQTTILDISSLSFPAFVGWKGNVTGEITAIYLKK